MSRESDVEVILTRTGLGHRIGNQIFMNRLLLNVPILYWKIYKHELSHINGEKDIDWREPFDKDLFMFILKTPSTWTHFLPFWIVDRKIIYSKLMIKAWVITILWVIAMWRVALWIL